MAIDAVKIPADVQVEEKIFGPVSLRQILVLMVCGGVSYVIWGIAQKAGHSDPITTAICWIPLAIGAAFAFIKINDVSLLRLLLLTIERFDKPTVRSFGPRAGININIRTTAAPEKKEEEPEAPQENTSISELSSILDTELRNLHPDEPTEDFSLESELEAEAESEPDLDPVDPSKITVSPMDEDDTSIDTITSPNPSFQ